MNKDRFNRLPIPIHKVTPSGIPELFQMFPGLKRYFNRIPDEVLDLKDLPKGRTASYLPEISISLVKYIMFLYDPESDLISEYPDDYKVRKEAAAREAGFKRKSSGKWPDEVISFMEFRDPQMIDWVIDYLKVRKNHLFNEIVLCEEELELIIRNRTKAISDGVLSRDSLKDQEIRSTKLQTLYRQFWAETGEAKEMGEEKIFPVRPENVYKEMGIPEEIWAIRQPKDVLK